MLQYNKLIGEKPTHGNLQEKITAQNIWANQCRLLLIAIHNEVQSWNTRQRPPIIPYAAP